MWIPNTSELINFVTLLVILLVKSNVSPFTCDPAVTLKLAANPN